MTWQPEVDELHERTRLAHLMGGEERVARQKAAGKLTIRERVDAMCDENDPSQVLCCEQGGNVLGLIVMGCAEIAGNAGICIEIKLVLQVEEAGRVRKAAEDQHRLLWRCLS